MIFGNKEVSQLKQEFEKKLDDTKQELSSKLDATANYVKEIYELLQELKVYNENISGKIKKDLNEINLLKADLEKALNRINSTSRHIEETAALNVKEVAEREVNAIKMSSKRYRDVEGELEELARTVHDLQLELSKFVTISRQINLIDFTLKQHKEDIVEYEQEKNELVNENERLKTIMAKMKRMR